MKEVPDPPKCLPTKRFTDPMDGCDSKLFARIASVRNRDVHALIIPFSGDESDRSSVVVSAPKSIINNSKENGCGIVLLFNRDTGTVYEYDINDFSRKPYKSEHGEERVQPERGLRSAKYRWDSVGNDIVITKSIHYP